MLYLNPPYYTIDGVSLFPDHADKLQYYFLPMMPHLSTMTDSSGVERPVLQLIEYEGAAGTGGFLNFDVNLGIKQDVLDSVAQKLRQKARLDDTPHLSPVTFVDGSVRLLILGADSAADPAAAPAAGPRFVVKMQNASKPSLFGDNQATFSVQLDQDGATIIEQALKGALAPVAVIYALDFVALRPAYNVHLSVDWNRVQTYMDDQFHANVLFFSTDIEKAIAKLIEDRVITIEIDTFVTDTDGGKDIVGDRDRAVAEVYDMIKNTFFESSLPPPNPNKPDGWDKAKDVAMTVSEMALTGGWASVASFSRKQVDLTRVDRKTLNLTISERTSVQRTIYPQGHLSGLLDVIKKAGLSLDDFILKVDLDNPWFQRRRLSIVSHADFDADSIDSIDVNMTYNGVIKSVSLTKASPRGSVDWSSVLADGKMVRPVTYTYSVNFAGVDTSQRPGQLTSAELTEIGDTLAIQPRSQLYGLTSVPIRTDTLPWDRYSSVEVECRYEDRPNNIRLHASAVLTSQSPGVTWQLFLRQMERQSFAYQLTYGLVTGATSTTPWLTSDSGKIDIRDPFPAKTAITVMPSVDWTTTDIVLVHLAYPDNRNPIAQKSFTFNKTNNGPQVFTVDRQDPTQTNVYFDAKIIGHNGQVFVVPGSVTSESFLIIQPGMKGHQIVTVKPEPVDFGAARVTEVDVQLRYVDQRNGLNNAETVKLVAQSDIQYFAYDYADASIGPEFRADIQLDNGQTRSLDWTPVRNNAVTIGLSRLV